MRFPRLIAAITGGAMLITVSAAPARAFEPITVTIATIWLVKFAATAILGAFITRSVFPPGSNVCKGEAGKLYSVPGSNSCLDGSTPDRVN